MDMSEELREPGVPSIGRDVVEVPIDIVTPNPFQPRREFDEVALEELAASIRRHGVLQPVVVRAVGDGYQLVAGERRLRAARAAGLDRIPARVSVYSDAQMLEVALVENLQREDISALEAAEAYHQLSDRFGLTQEQISRRVGKSRSAVANTMRLMSLPPFIQQSLRAAEITEGHARALLSVGDREQQKKLWERVVLAGASVREAEQLAREPQTSPPAAPPRGTATPRTDPNLLAIEAALRQALGTRVALTAGKRGGTLTIEYYGNEDLERIVGLILGSELVPE
jgi:ParB family chromosome partitioning protein